MANGTGINLEPATVTTGNGMVFTVAGKKNIDIKPDNFKCPLCRTNVETVFRAEDAMVGDFLDFETIGLTVLNAMDLVNIKTSDNNTSESLVE
jgi:hypothetical protein